MEYKTGLYGYRYGDKGWIPVRLFAVTYAEEKTILHMTFFFMLYDTPADIAISADSPMLIEHLALNADNFKDAVLLEESAAYPDEEMLYANWLTLWNDGSGYYYSVSPDDVVADALKKGSLRL